MVNLTIFSSIVQILFVQQDYRTINFLTESYDKELSNRIMRIASDSLKPISNFVIGKTNTGRKKLEEPILNVVVPNNISNEHTVKSLRQNIFPDDVTLVISHQNVNDADMERWLNLSIKVILLSENLTILFNTFENAQNLKINLFPFDSDSTRNSIATAFSTKEQSIQFQGENFYILFQYVPPGCVYSLTGELSKYLVTGPDASLTETLLKRLNVNPKLSHNVQLPKKYYEDYRNKTNWLLKSYEQYYPNVMTNVFIRYSNKTLVL